MEIIEREVVIDIQYVVRIPNSWISYKYHLFSCLAYGFFAPLACDTVDAGRFKGSVIIEYATT
jgi:hypothetical protein